MECPLRVQAVWKRLLFFACDGRVGLDDGFSAFEALFGWCGPMGRNLRFCAALGRIREQIEGDERLGPHRGDQRGDAHNVHDTFEIVGQNVECHFGADPFQRLHLEVR